MARQRPQQSPESHADLTALLTAQAQQEVVQSLLRLNPNATQALAGDPVRQAQENVQTLRAAVAMQERRNRAAASPAGQQALKAEIALTRQLSQERQRFNEQLRRAAVVPPTLRERFGGAVAGAREAIGGAAVGAGVAAGAATAGAFHLVGQFNPYLVERFNRSVSDLMAVVGRDLAPVVEGATARVRALADAYLTLDPEQRKMVTTVGEMALVATAATLALKGAAVGLGVLARHPFIVALAAGGAAAIDIRKASEEGLEHGRRLDERNRRIEAGQRRPEDFAPIEPALREIAAAPPDQKAAVAARRESFQRAKVEDLNRQVAAYGVADFDGSNRQQAMSVFRLFAAGMEEARARATSVFTGEKARGPLAIAQEARDAMSELRAIRAVQDDLTARPAAGRPAALPKFNPAHGALQEGFAGAQPAAPAAARRADEPQAGGRSGWGMVADILAGKPGPNAGASIGAAYNPNAGVISDVTAAYRDLLSASLRGSALGGGQKDSGEQTVGLLDDIRGMLRNIEQAAQRGGPAPPPPDGQPLRLR